MVITGEEVCCNVVFRTLVDVSVISVTWSEVLMSSAISCPLWSIQCTSAKEWSVRSHLQ